jgi:DNA repair protein RecN (Recombination protein N)
MLSSLTIKNFALIDELSVDFATGLSAISGETGAGKSIIIDALRIALGERINSSMVRSGAANCVIEAVFALEKDFLKDNPDISEHLADEESLIINRTFTADGKGKIKINGLNVSLAQLKSIGDRMVDFHGPHDHQALLQKESHILMLDSLSNTRMILGEYKGLFHERAQLLAKLQEMSRDKSSREREIDMLSHQVKELSALELTREKYDEYISEQAKMNNTQELSACVGEMINILSEDEASVVSNLMKAASLMRKLNRIDATTEELATEMNVAHEGIDNVISRLNEYVAGLEFEPDRAERVNTICDNYKDALRKYGSEIEDVAKFFNESKARLDFLNNFDENDKTLREDIAGVESKLKQIAQSISELRLKAAKILKKTIEKELLELGFAKVLFDCKITLVDLREDGFDDVEFYISPNPGEPLKPLADIVSGGESARIMLALKKALIKADKVPVLIFDEIDAQIGGRLGTVTGMKLKELSAQRQVLVITHLAQIAAYADTHFKVAKKEKSGRTVTTLNTIDGDGRISELAQMMSGSSESKASLTHARDMLLQAQK